VGEELGLMMGDARRGEAGEGGVVLRGLFVALLLLYSEHLVLSLIFGFALRPHELV